MPYRRPPLGAVLAKNKTEYPRAGAGEFLNKFRFNKLRIKVIMSFFSTRCYVSVGLALMWPDPFLAADFYVVLCVFFLCARKDLTATATHATQR